MSELFDQSIMDSLLHFAKYGDIDEKIFIGIKTLLITCHALVGYLPIERTFNYVWRRVFVSECEFFMPNVVPFDDQRRFMDHWCMLPYTEITCDSNNHKWYQFQETSPNKILLKCAIEKCNDKRKNDKHTDYLIKRPKSIYYNKKCDSKRKNDKRNNHIIKQPNSRYYKK